MKSMRWALLVMVPMLAHAADVRQDYRQQWPLQVTGSDAGIYQLTLNAAVYRSAHDAALRDVTVIDARGEELPAAWLPADAASAAAARRQRPPLFAVPAGAAPANGDLQLIAERDASGAVRRLEGRVVTGAAAAAGNGGSWLIDASALRDRPRALLLDWDGDMPVQAQLRVEGSDDLRDWRVLASDATVMALDNQTRRLQQRRIALDEGARYLRLVPVSGQLPALRVVEAELEGITAPAPLQWLELPGTAKDAAVVYACRDAFRSLGSMSVAVRPRPSSGSWQVVMPMMRHGYSVPAPGWRIGWARGRPPRRRRNFCLPQCAIANGGWSLRKGAALRCRACAWGISPSG